MGWTFPDNEIDISSRITFDWSWHDVDLGTADDVPSGTTAIIIHVRNTDNLQRYFTTRPNGCSQDHSSAYLYMYCQKYYYVKLDANRIFEVNATQGGTGTKVGVVGYTDDDYGFTDPVDKSASGTGSYEDVDVSAIVPSDAEGVWIEALNYYSVAYRKNGASDDYYQGNNQTQTLWFMGLDENKLFEQKVSNASQDTYITGYWKSEAALLDSYVDKTPGSTGSWVDIDCSANVASDAIAGIFLYYLPYNNDYKYALRKKGSTDDFTAIEGIRLGAYSQLIAVVGLDNDKICQGYIQSISHSEKIYLIGYIGTGITLPTVTTAAATNVTGTTATGNGEVISDGGTTITARGFCWSTSATPTTADSKVIVAGTTGVFSGSITGLSTGTTYHYRAYATNAIGTAYGADYAISTVLALPTVVTLAATGITAISATANGAVVDAGGGTILERGFAWGASPNPTITEDNKVSVSGTTGAFSAPLVGLSSDTTYHVRAFATNEAGTAYGADVSFTALSSGSGGGGGSGGGSTANIAVLYWPDDAGVAYAIDVSTGNLLLFYKRIDTLPYSVDDVIHWNDGFDMVYAASALSLALSTEDDEYDRYRAWVYDNIATSVADILRSISINKKVI